MPSVELTGQIIGTTHEGLGEWVVVVKAPSQQRIRYWTTEHAACGTRLDLPQTMIQAAVKGKGSLPPCAACTPADELPAVSHGQHYACGTVHPIGTSCGKAGPGECKHAVKLHACAECGPLAGFEVIAPTADSVGGLVRRLPATPDAVEADSQAPEAAAWSLDAIAEEPDVEPAPAAVEDDEPELEPLRLVPAVAAELAQAYAALPVAPDMKVNGHELVTADEPAPVARVHGRAEAFEGPQDMLEILWKGCSREASPPTGRAGMASLGGCERKLGYRLAFGKAASEGGWRPFVGTAVDAAVKPLFLADNERRVAAGLPERWLVGLFVDDPAEGELDIFDIEQRRVVDLKTSGVTTIKRTAAGSVDDRYEVQLDLYGEALSRRGYEVRSVALLVVPAAGELRANQRSRDAVPAWYERPFDPQRAHNAIARRDRINLLIAFAKANDVPLERVLASLSATEDWCGGCPALRDGMCPGAAVTPAAPALTFGGAA